MCESEEDSFVLLKLVVFFLFRGILVNEVSCLGSRFGLGAWAVTVCMGLVLRVKCELQCVFVSSLV